MDVIYIDIYFYKLWLRPSANFKKNIINHFLYNVIDKLRCFTVPFEGWNLKLCTILLKSILRVMKMEGYVWKAFIDSTISLYVQYHIDTLNSVS